MKKILFAGILFASISMIKAQYGDRVGILTDKPSQTLDVKGTMRIKSPGEAKKGSLIFWNKDTNQQWVESKDNDEAQRNMYSISIAIHLGQRKEDWANWVPLGINSDKYEAVLTQSFLVKTKAGAHKGANYYYNEAGAKNELPAYIITPFVYSENYRGATVGAVQAIKFNDGKLRKDDGGDNKVEGAGFWAIPQKDARIRKNGNNYEFYGDYRDTTPYEDTNYTWVINLLVLRKDWVVE